MAKKNGGVREGSGRGPRNSISTAIGQARALRDGALLPLDYMLRVMRDENVPAARRDDMAKACAPYVHARFTALAVGAMPGSSEAGVLPIGYGGEVHVYLPSNGRRVSMPDAANDSKVPEFELPMLVAVAGGVLSE